MLTVSSINKMACVIVSAASLSGALMYAHGQRLISDIGYGALIGLMMTTSIFGLVFGSSYLSRMPIVKNTARHIWGTITQNPQNVARLFGSSVLLFTILTWYSTTVPKADPRIQNLTSDQALLLGLAAVIASVCIGRYLRSTKYTEFNHELAPWFLYPLTWFIVSTLCMVLTM